MAINNFVPRSAKKNVRIADKVLMYRKNPVAKSVGPYVIKMRTAHRSRWKREIEQYLHRLISSSFSVKVITRRMIRNSRKQCHELSRDNNFQQELFLLKSVFGKRHVFKDVQPSEVICERQSGLAVVNAERANGVPRKRRFSAFRAVAGAISALFNNVPRSISRVHL